MTFKELHAQFHQCAADIVVAHEEGYFVEAFSLAKNDLVSLSEQIAMAIVQLLQAIQARVY
ncbi:hypothetical protein [Neisseria sp. Ec49-e6-T10]|uniref:hypothetical protein n=1 Tax=Neisseria sp. Ec49-e6-T10 TaxID=3140744 RepID=UPI003EBDAA74